MSKKQATLFWVIRLVIWSIWFFGIALDGLSMGMSWLPWVGVGFVFAWRLDWYFRKDKIPQAMVLTVPYMILTDFIIGMN